jgi:glutamine synthetase type III
VSTLRKARPSWRRRQRTTATTVQASLQHIKADVKPAMSDLREIVDTLETWYHPTLAAADVSGHAVLE